MTNSACNVPACDRKVLAKGLCNAHYLQQRAGKEFRKPRKVSAAVRDDQGNKECARCGLWKGLDEFGTNKNTGDGAASNCLRCNRFRQLFFNYRITEASYTELFNRQGGRCAICRVEPEDEDSLHVDHDHACCSERGKSCGTCVRGLLCAGCNLGIGHLADDPKRLRAAADYLERG